MHTHDSHEQVYTHIVVGAGSAGCVVAKRIAENQAFNVLLIEAGPDAGFDASQEPIGIKDARRVPMKGQSDLFDPRIDWNVPVNIPGGGIMHVPQAKIVGGGSSINGGTALRNTQMDCDEWVALGNEAWDFESVCRAYEDLGGDQRSRKPGVHPIVRASRAEAGQIQEAFLKGAEKFGLSWIDDLDKAGVEGSGASPVCRRGSCRITAANTCIDPVRQQSDISILPQSQVDRLVIEGTRVRGLLLTNGKSISATHEIVLSAGAVFSPAVLQRSGIGPSKLLSQLGIGVVIDLPVGENLSDHPCVPVVARPKPGSYGAGDYSLQMQARWSSQSNVGAVDLQMVCFSYLYARADPMVQQRSIGGTVDGHVAGIGCNVNKPLSLGTIRITERDGSTFPEISPHYLESHQDLRAAREVVRKAFSVISSSPMQAVLGPPIGIDSDIIEEDEALDEYITGQFSSTYHFCGSCRMAAREKGGVVDQSGRVYGLEGLRVCDASILPTVPAANTMWSTMMFAHRIGCSIRDGREVLSVVKG